MVEVFSDQSESGGICRLIFEKEDGVHLKRRLRFSKENLHQSLNNF